MNVKTLFFAGLIVSTVTHAAEQITKIVPLHHLNAHVCAGVLNGLSDAVIVYPLSEKNRLIIIGTPNDCLQMEQVIKICDYPRPKIASIAVYLSDGRAYGFL